jgi:acetyl-CoA acetyltransferase
VVNDIVIVDGVRTPIGSHGGGLRDVTPQESAKIVMVETFG